MTLTLSWQPTGPISSAFREFIMTDPVRGLFRTCGAASCATRQVSDSPPFAFHANTARRYRGVKRGLRNLFRGIAAA